MSWQAQANCAGADDAMFPQGGSLQYVRRLCTPCPVRAECLAFALEHHIAHGVWGGMTTAERVRLARLAAS